MFSKTPQEHYEHLKQIFEILSANGLVVNRAKCVLGVSELDFLGFHVDADGVVPLPEKVEAIRATKSPTTVKELQRFNGMVGYYRRFVRQAAHHMDYLFEALVGKPKVLKWTVQSNQRCLGQRSDAPSPHAKRHVSVSNRRLQSSHGRRT